MIFLRLIPVYGVLLSGALVFGEGNVSLAYAVDELIRKNPLIAAIESEIQGLDTLRSKTRQYLDPTMSTSVDCIELSEFGFGIEQTFERRVKQNIRKELFEQKIELKKLEQVRYGYTVQAEASRRYVPIFFGLQKMHIVDSMIDENLTLETMLQKYVEAGAIMHTDILKSKLAIEKLRMQRLDLSLQVARARAHFCGLSPADSMLLMSVDASINENYKIPDIKQIAAILEKNYGNDIVKAESNLLETEKKYIKAEAKKDLTLGLVYTRNRIDRENTLTAEVSIELPLFRNVNREQADLEYQKNAILLRYKNTLTETQGEIRDIYKQISIFEQKNELITDTIIPSLMNQYNAYMTIYKKGKGSFRDISEIMMELLAYRMELLDNKMNITLLAIDVSEKCGIKPEVLM
jgi:outer membrane protein TolC